MLFDTYGSGLCAVTLSDISLANNCCGRRIVPILASRVESADIQKILADQQINMEEFSVWEQHVSGGKGIRGIFHEC